MSNEPVKPPRRVLATPFGRVALASGMALTLGAAASAGAPAGVPAAAATAPSATLWLASGTEGGEGGESGGAPVAADDRAGLLVALMKVEARARTAVDLTLAGQGKAAKALLNDTWREDFEAMEPALKAHKAPIFEPELLRLKERVTGGVAARTETLGALQSGIDGARAALAPRPAEEFAAVVALLREAGEDLGRGLKDGRLTDEPAEYRDARGYVLAADAALGRLQGASDATVKAAADKARAALAPVLAALPDVAPAGTVAADPALILGAAASVELAAYKVKG